jgi:DNA replication initiation complex subunit (GINS family)
MITQESLPEQLIPRCLDVLSKLTPNEKELIRIVVEVVHELRDSQDEEEEEMVGSSSIISPKDSANESSRILLVMQMRQLQSSHIALRGSPRRLMRT